MSHCSVRADLTSSLHIHYLLNKTVLYPVRVGTGDSPVPLSLKSNGRMNECQLSALKGL